MTLVVVIIVVVLAVLGFGYLIFRIMRRSQATVPQITDRERREARSRGRDGRAGTGDPRIRGPAGAGARRGVVRRSPEGRDPRPGPRRAGRGRRLRRSQRSLQTLSDWTDHSVTKCETMRRSPAHEPGGTMIASLQKSGGDARRILLLQRLLQPRVLGRRPAPACWRSPASSSCSRPTTATRAPCWRGCSSCCCCRCWASSPTSSSGGTSAATHRGAARSWRRWTPSPPSR